MLQSSFMSRGSRSSLPVFQKHGSSTVRSFVFERDDSNSKSAVSMSEDSSDLVSSVPRGYKAYLKWKFQGLFCIVNIWSLFPFIYSDIII